MDHWIKPNVIILALLFLSLAMGVHAEPRIENKPAYCHFPLNVANANNEDKIGNCRVNVRIEDDGSATALATYDEPLTVSQPTIFIFDWMLEDGNVPCVIEDDGGAAVYHSYNWQSLVTTNYLGGERLRSYVLTCRDGEQQ